MYFKMVQFYSALLFTTKENELLLYFLFIFKIETVMSKFPENEMSEGDDEILSRLERILENQSISAASDTSSTFDIIQRISQHITEIAETHSPNDAGDGGYDSEEERYEEGGMRPDGPAVRSANRPTPYEVWATKHEYNHPPKKPVKLTEKGWDSLVNHLHSSEHVKKKTLMQRQHKEIAEQLKSLPFKPELNANSLKIAQGTVPLPKRQNRILKQRGDYLMKQREQKLKDEMKECSFVPKSDLSAEKNNAWLRKAKKSTERTVDDIMDFHREKLIRRQQMKQLQEELQGRELTFTPQLSRHSAVIVQKMQKEGRLEQNQTTGQTVRHDIDVKAINPYKSEYKPEASSTDPGHEEEIFEPQIESRTFNYVHPIRDPIERFYTQPFQKAKDAHNVNIAVLNQGLKNVKHAMHEREMKPHDEVKAAWVEGVQNGKLLGRNRAEEELMKGSDTGLNFVSYKHRYDAILQKVHPTFGKI